MVKLRLRRKGKKGYPVYDIVAVDVRARRDGAFLERVGFYNPNTEISSFNFKHDRAIYWLRNGAQPTNIVKRLLSYDGVLLHNALLFKGKSESEIAAELEKHRETVRARYLRRKELRVKRAANKLKAEAEAKKKAEAEEAAAAEAEAETPAEEAAEAAAEAEAAATEEKAAE